MVNLILVAFHACMATFTAAGIIPAYANIAEDLGVTMQQASYLTSLQIAILGGAPLFWKPLSNRFGRRPIFLLSLILSLVCNIGCAKSTTYSSVAACRALVAFFISPASAIGSAIVMETTFKKDRARYMGVWTLMVTLGVPIGPFIFGFVTYRLNYTWIYWILAMVSAASTELCWCIRVADSISRVIDQRWPVHLVSVLWTRDSLGWQWHRSRGGHLED
jgi:MFS family permease